MIEQKFKCPNCGQIASFYGNPEETKIISCAVCNSKGRITISTDGINNNYAIEVSHLKKVYGDLIAVNDISLP